MRRCGSHLRAFAVAGSLPGMAVADTLHCLFVASFAARSGAHSLRQSPWDCVFLALWLDHDDGLQIVRGGFDGFYT
jgi:hypothetical protein